MGRPTTDPVRRLVLAALLSLIPWTAFLVVLELWTDGPVYVGGLVGWAAFVLLFVAPPSMVPIAAARHTATRTAAVVIMTWTAVGITATIVTSESSTAGLAVFAFPYVAIPLAGVIWIGQAVIQRMGERRLERDAVAVALAGPSDRLAGLAIDVVLVGAVLQPPLTAMSHAKHEVAALVVGVAVATMYLGAPIAWRGRTFGQWVLGLSDADAASGGRVGPLRAVTGSLIVVLAIILWPLGIAELVVVISTGRSLTDRLLRTSVVTRRRTETSAHPSRTEVA